MQRNPRQQIGETLNGDVLEIGPGNSPFPTANGARVKFADRSVEGGRDANWPELIGAAPGPDADFNVNIDVDGLSEIANGSFDAVVASHVLEHLANPIKAIQEMQRVLRAGGRLVLIVPDRSLTFDAVRAPTPFSHVLQEFYDGVTEVDNEHIKEYCAAIYEQPSIHPDLVREWHNPIKLDAAHFELHRRRSIHVHCWLAEEFASLIAGSLAEGLMSWRLSSLYFVDDFSQSMEFGLVLDRLEAHEDPKTQCLNFIEDWVKAVLSSPNSDVRRVSVFERALYRDFAGKDGFNDLILLPSSLLAETLHSERRTNSLLKTEIGELESSVRAMEQSHSWKITAPLRQTMNAIRRSR